MNYICKFTSYIFLRIAILSVPDNVFQLQLNKKLIFEARKKKIVTLVQQLLYGGGASTETRVITHGTPCLTLITVYHKEAHYPTRRLDIAKNILCLGLCCPTLTNGLILHSSWFFTLSPSDSSNIIG